jgi:hypothetical protein
VLGLIIWMGVGDHEQLVALHITIGVVLVVTLWAVAAIAARSGVPPSTVAFAAAWGLLVAVFGLTHEDLLIGSWHWTIRILHVAISMGTIWWGRRLAKLIGQALLSSRATLSHPPMATSAPR